MKRYLTFIGEVYYPNSGMGDFKGDFDSLENAISFVEKSVDKRGDYETAEKQWKFTWASIWDTETRSEVWSK